MTRNEMLIICAGALDKYGERHQRIKVMEELGELQHALARYELAVSDDVSDGALVLASEQVREEIADVEILLTQLRMVFGDQRITQWRENKLAMLGKRLTEWNNARLKKLVDSLRENKAPDEIGAEAEEINACEGCEIRS